MSRLNVSRFEALAGRAFNVKGPGSLVELEQSVFGTFPLDSASAPEYLKLQGIHLWGGVSISAAVAAQYSWVGLHNPAGSGVLAVVTGFEVIQTAIGRFAMFVRDGSVGGVGSTNSAPLDVRSGVLGGVAREPRVRPEQWQAATVTYGQQVSEIMGGAGHRWSYPVVLGPDQSLIVRPFGTNTEQRGAFYWYEREAAPGELK